jgi:hypothetical protein
LIAKNTTIQQLLRRAAVIRKSSELELYGDGAIRLSGSAADIASADQA